MKLLNDAIILLICGCTVAASGCADPHNTVPISGLVATPNAAIAEAAKAATPSIVLLGQRVETSRDHTYVTADLALINPLSVPVTYGGYTMDSYQTRPELGEISPQYSLKLKDNEDDEWGDYPVAWCGTGLGKMIVRPGEAGRFQVPIHAPFSAAQVRLACTWPADSATTNVELQSPSIPGPGR